MTHINPDGYPAFRHAHGYCPLAFARDAADIHKARRILQRKLLRQRWLSMLHWVMAITCVGLIIFFAQRVDAEPSRYSNGGGGGTVTDVDVSDVTYFERRMRQDMTWADRVAATWDEEDHETCGKAGPGLALPQVHVTLYARCIQRQANLRILFMLRRGCIGTIASVCNGLIDQEKEVEIQ